MKKVTIIIIIIFIIAVVWFFPMLRSTTIMSVYSAIHNNESVMRESGLDIKIPGGLSTSSRDWYPFTMTFNAGQFKKNTDMSIIYNFGAFDPITRTSSFYDTETKYYSAFYGAYVIQTDDGSRYGFVDDNLNFSDITAAFEYDYKNLVLQSLGKKDFNFTPVEYDISEVEYIGYSGWKRVDAVVNTNGVKHAYDGFKRSYIQYGRPVGKIAEDFPALLMVGRFYIRYFEEYKCTVVFYIIAPYEQTILECDKTILSRSTIK